MPLRKDSIGPRHVIGLLLWMVLCGGASAAADPPQADSKDRADTKELKTLATIVVTGTHIRGIDVATEHPLQVLTLEDIRRTGLTSVGDVVQSLVVDSGQTVGRNVNNGNDGAMTVNLHSLGANRTLVLLNGQRFATQVDGVVDLSGIPLAMVERIEVLKDGASAIYGSDAIAGVVNIITRRNYQGAEAGAYFGQTNHGDGRRTAVDFTFGRSGDKWNAAFGIQISDDQPVMASARRISSLPAPGLPPDATGTYQNQYAVFVIPPFYPMVLTKGRPGTSPDDFHLLDYATDFNFNPAPWQYLLTPLEQRAVFAQFRQELSDSVAFNADGMFNQRRSAQQFAAPRVTVSDVIYPPGNPQAFGVSPDNVYNPFGEPVIVVSTRWPDAYPRRFEQTVDTSHLHVGLDGLFTLWGRDWLWNADATQTQARQSESSGPYAYNAKLQLALGPSFLDAQGVARCGTPDAVIEGCVPLDLFTGQDRFTPAMMDYVNINASNHRSVRSDSLHFGVTSELASLRAGPLAFAAGLERRLERGTDQPDALVAAGQANGTGLSIGPTEGAYAVNEAYAEFDVPLLSGVRFARQLAVNLATRYSDYSTFGSTNNAGVGLRWKPADDLLVRARWAQGFRAPSIAEAYGGTIDGMLADVLDPCATQGGYVPPPAVAANCLANGVPPDVVTNFTTLSSIGGNPALQPETSRSLTGGLMYSPAWLPGLDVSVDWYRIEIENAIADPGAQYFLDGCYVHNDPTACARITRGPDGSLQHISAVKLNISGGLEAEGWDFALNWKRDTRVGTFNLGWESAYIDYWGAIGHPPYGAILPDGSVSEGNVVGTNNPLYGVIWRLRSVATLAWQRGAWGASLTGRYFSPIQENCEEVTYTADTVGDPSLYALCSDPNRVVDGIPAPRNRVGAVTYVDLTGSWTASWKGVFTLGIRNAFDREPPHAWSYSGNNSFFPEYDVPGRFFWMSYRQRF